jgi:chromosome segregation ATPase
MEALEASRRHVRKLEMEIRDQGPLIELEARLERCQEDLARSESDMANLQAMRKLEIKAYQDMVDKYSDSDAPEKLETAMASLQDVRGKLELAEAEKNSLSGDLEQKILQCLALEEEIDQHKERMSIAVSNLDAANRTLREQEEEIASTREQLQHISTKQSEEQVTIVELREQLQELEREREDCVFKQPASASRRMQGDLSAEVASLKRQIRQKDRDIRRTSRTHSRTISRLSNAIVLVCNNALLLSIV